FSLVRGEREPDDRGGGEGRIILGLSPASTGCTHFSKNLIKGTRDATVPCALSGELGIGKCTTAFAFGGGRGGIEIIVFCPSCVVVVVDDSDKEDNDVPPSSPELPLAAAAETTSAPHLSAHNKSNV